MNIKLTSIYSWSIGSYAKAKYFTAKEQNKDDIHTALGEIVNSNKYNTIASFYTDIECIDNPELNGVYDVFLCFNRNGDTFFEMEEHSNPSYYLSNLQIMDGEKYRAVTQDLFEAIVATREFQKFAQKATKKIQDCFKEVIEPLYKGELRVSDELDEDERRAIKNLMRLKGKIVSSATLKLSNPEFENM